MNEKHEKQLYDAPDCRVTEISIDGCIAASAPDFEDGGDLFEDGGDLFD